MKIPNQNSAPMVTKEVVTGYHMAMLLQAAGIMLQALLNPMRDVEEPQSPSKIDGGAKAAAEVTFINICNKLDEIVADGARWTIDGHIALEYKLARVYDAHTALLITQQKVAEEFLTPHFRYKPTLLALEDDTWIAFLGDPEHLENAIIGFGGTPEQAILAFDLVFQGKIPRHLMKWLAQREDSVNKGTETPPFPNTPEQPKENEQSKTVDGTGSENPKRVKDERRKPRRNRPRSGEDCDGDKPKG
jgi:hypothetical protein